MRILILGGGGREHALAWGLSNDRTSHTLFIAPGNAGTAALGRNVDLDILNFKELGDFALKNDIQLIVVGPEAPLVAGIFDYFKKDPDLNKIAVFGPSSHGALLEGSKSFAKEFMGNHRIPTAPYREVRLETLEEGRNFIRELRPPIVIKADGLAAGKGVLIIPDRDLAEKELEAVLKGKFGKAGEKVVIEAFLPGIEISVFAITDGKQYVLMPTAKDYKRIGEGDTGLNTGGMGAIAPVPIADDELMAKIEGRIVKPTIEGLAKEGITYRGVIYFGLMIVNGEPFVIEYNCRFGDPEAEVLIPLTDAQWGELFLNTAEGRLPDMDLPLHSKAAATVVLASGGYPGDYEKGKEIRGLDKVADSIVFHAGTMQDANGRIRTAGGRVLAITSLAPTLKKALEMCLENAEKIEFEGKYFRKDIGYEFI